MIEDDSLFRIYQDDDLTWHKGAAYNITHPQERLENLINGIDNTRKASLWTDYNSKTKTLTATYSDGSATAKLDGGEFTITFIAENGTTTHIIKDVGTTIVTLPENIIDDTQP